MNIFSKISVPIRLQNLVFIGGIVLFALLLFYPLFAPIHCLFTTDDNIGSIKAGKDSLTGAFLGSLARIFHQDS